MYHIKEDKRSQDSANRIYRSLRHILVNKNLEDVSISDISKECGISRMTFYRLFDNINDILEYKINDFYKEYKNNVLNKDDKLLYFFEFWSYHKDLIRLLNNNAYHILLSIFIKDNSNISNVKFIYESNIKASILASILSTWSLRKGIEKPCELKEIVMSIFKKNLILSI